MGNPHRFIGTGVPIDLEEGQSLPPRWPVAVTFRTQRQELLLRPSSETNELILGCLGRALDRYPEMQVHVVTILSNHGDLLISPPSADVMWGLMRDFLSTVATRLNGHHDREGTFWERRYRAIPILDEDALEDRFAYALLQGTKENLAMSARDWPGVSSVRPLMGGPKLVGRWRDGTREYELRRQRERKLARAAARCRALELPEVEPVVHEYPVELVPLPHWQHLSTGQWRARVTDIVKFDERETRARHARDGTRPLGAAAVLATDPFTRPHASKRSPAPACHTSSPVLRRGFHRARSVFVSALRKGAAALSLQLEPAGVPIGASTGPLCASSARTGQVTKSASVVGDRAARRRAGPDRTP